MRLEKLQETVQQELDTWIGIWDEVKEIVGVSSTADHGRVLAALKGLRREVEELKEKQNSVARHAGFTSAGRLFQHIETQPEGFLTGRQPSEVSVVLPPELLRDNAHWFKPGKNGEKPITQLQVKKWLREVQQAAREVLREAPHLKDQMVDAYKKNHPGVFIELCRGVFHEDITEVEVVTTVGMMLAGMNGYEEWTREEDRSALERASMPWNLDWETETAYRSEKQAKEEGDPELQQEIFLAHWLKEASAEAIYGDVSSPDCLQLVSNNLKKIAWDELWDDRLEMLNRLKQMGLKGVKKVVEQRAKRIEREEEEGAGRAGER